VRDALVARSNATAAACINALGYGWIKGALAAGGFFLDPPARWPAPGNKAPAFNLPKADGV
jgi:hypothetical protein